MENVRAPRHVETTTGNEPSSNTPGAVIDMQGGPLINEAEFTRTYDMAPLEPAVIPHHTVEVNNLEPGKVRPAQ